MFTKSELELIYKILKSMQIAPTDINAPQVVALAQKIEQELKTKPDPRPQPEGHSQKNKYPRQ